MKRVAESLVIHYTGWIAILAKFGGAALARWLVARRFQVLLRLLLRAVLAGQAPFDDSHPLDLVFNLARIHDVRGITPDEGTALLDCVLIALDDPAFLGEFQDEMAKRHIALARRRFTLARKTTDQSNACVIAMATAQATENAVRLLTLPAVEPRHFCDLLSLVGAICQPCLDHPNQSLDSNYMIAYPPSSSLWTECKLNADGTNAFGEARFNAAHRVLVIKHTTNPDYLNFWVPVFQEMGKIMPGANGAWRNARPMATFPSYLEDSDFGENVELELRTRQSETLRNLRVSVFLSFPVFCDGSMVGIVNLNCKDDEIKFHDTAEVDRVYAAVRPVLAVLGQLTKVGCPPPPV